MVRFLLEASQITFLVFPNITYLLTLWLWPDLSEFNWVFPLFDLSVLITYYYILKLL